MNESYVFFNGKIVPEKEVSISIRSKVVNYGLACFEGIRAYWDEEGQQLYGFRFKSTMKDCFNPARLCTLIFHTVSELSDITAEL